MITSLDRDIKALIKINKLFVFIECILIQNDERNKVHIIQSACKLSVSSNKS